MIKTQAVKKILFLGYNEKETVLINFLKNNGCKVTHSSDIEFDFHDFDLIISFGFRYIIKTDIIEKAPPIINLHISLLPFNRGAHPNFWAHFDKTPSGVTIHLIDQGIDTGDYLFQEELFFDIQSMTFRQSHKVLISSIENLFIKNYESIINLNLKPHKYAKDGTHHSSKDLPNDFSGWDSNIHSEIIRLKSKA